MGLRCAQLRTVATKEGIRGLYAGYGAFMLRDLPFDAIEFVAYEQGKKAWTKFKGAELNPGETSIVGAFAGGVTGEQTRRRCCMRCCVARMLCSAACAVQCCCAQLRQLLCGVRVLCSDAVAVAACMRPGARAVHLCAVHLSCAVVQLPCRGACVMCKGARAVQARCTVSLPSKIGIVAFSENKQATVPALPLCVGWEGVVAVLIRTRSWQGILDAGRVCHMHGARNARHSTCPRLDTVVVHTTLQCIICPRCPTLLC
jgi:hypothetical protein